MGERDQDGVFEGRLKKLKNPGAEKHEEEEDDESPAADLSVQARVDSVALAKGRLSSGAGSEPRQDHLDGKDRTHLPPSGAKSRLGSSEKQKQPGEPGALYFWLRLLLASLPASMTADVCSDCCRWLQGGDTKAEDKLGLWRQGQGRN